MDLIIKIMENMENKNSETQLYECLSKIVCEDGIKMVDSKKWNLKQSFNHIWSEIKQVYAIVSEADVNMLIKGCFYLGLTVFYSFIFALAFVIAISLTFAVRFINIAVWASAIALGLYFTAMTILPMFGIDVVMLLTALGLL